MKPLATSVVGSYPQPDWLVNRPLLSQLMAPRVRAREIWRIEPEWLGQAQDDATLLAIRDQERAGLDIVTDGEIRRESYSNRFANALGGVARERHGEIVGRTGNRIPVPVVTGPIERLEPVEVRDLRFLREQTDRLVKVTLPGPFTMAQQAVDEHYGSRERLALALADAVRAEVEDLFAAGADIVQLDEPWLEARAEEARRYGVRAVNRALEDAAGTTALHLCFGYAALVGPKQKRAYDFLSELADACVDQVSIEAAQPRLELAALRALEPKTVMVGVLDLADDAAESAETVADRIRRALDVVPAERLIVTPDCGMKYLPRPLAYAKLRALTAGAELVRAQL